MAKESIDCMADREPEPEKVLKKKPKKEERRKYVRVLWGLNNPRFVWTDNKIFQAKTWTCKNDIIEDEDTHGFL